MKLFILAAGALFATVATASAQSSIDVRQGNQAARINQGVAKGQLNPNETARLARGDGHLLGRWLVRPRLVVRSVNDDAFKARSGHGGHIRRLQLRRYRKIRGQRVNWSRHSEILQRVKKQSRTALTLATT